MLSSPILLSLNSSSRLLSVPLALLRKGNHAGDRDLIVAETEQLQLHQRPGTGSHAGVEI